jgi:serine protease AprX
MDQYMYQNDHYLILVAAGNDGYGSNTVGSPATAKNVLAVGAADHTQAAYRCVTYII